MKTIITRIKRLALALCFVTPLVSWAATSTYSTVHTVTGSATAYTSSAGNANVTWQNFNFRAAVDKDHLAHGYYFYLADGDTDIGETDAAVKLDSITLTWGGNAGGGIGANDTPYLVVTTADDTPVIIGVSAAGAAFSTGGTSTFAFSDVVLASNAKYRFYFYKNDVSGLTVGATLSGAVTGRVNARWHNTSGDKRADYNDIRCDGGAGYSVNCSFVVSPLEDGDATVLETSSTAVSVGSVATPVVIEGKVADGIVEVGSAATVSGVFTVCGEATTLELTDSLTATAFYFPATVTIDASAVSGLDPTGEDSSKTTELLSGALKYTTAPTVILPTATAGMIYETNITSSGISVTVVKGVDCVETIAANTSWSTIKPAGWIDSSVGDKPAITITYEGENPVTLTFDQAVQAGSLTLTGNIVVEASAAATFGTVTAGAGSVVEMANMTITTQSGSGVYRYRTGYPSTVPNNSLTYEYVGTDDSENPGTVNLNGMRGTVRTTGYMNITGYWPLLTNAKLDVVSGTTTLTAGSQAICGYITIREGATLVNTATDSLAYSGYNSIFDIYGTLDMGTSRWTVWSGATFNLRGGEVVGAGEGTSGALDFMGTCNVTAYANSTISANVKFRNALSNVTVNDGVTLTISGVTRPGYDSGGVTKKGAGTLKFTSDPYVPGGITVEAGTLAFDTESDVDPVVTYAASVLNSANMDYVSASNWKGRVVVSAVAAGTTTTQVALNKTGNENSYLTLNGISGNAWCAGSNYTVQPEITLAGDVNFQDGYSNKAVTFRKIAAGTGNLSLKSWSSCTGITYGFTTLDADNYTGTIQLDGSVLTFNVGDILKTGAAVGDKVLPLTVANNATVNLSNAKLNGEAADLEVKEDGIYVAVPTVTITVPNVANATVAVSDGTTTYTPTTEGGTTYSVPASSTITVTYTADEGYGLEGKSSYTLTNVAEGDAVTITDTEAKPYVARFNNVKYTTVQGAINAWAAVDDKGTAYLQQVGLLGDVTESSVTIPVGAAGMPCQINGGNHTLTAPVTIAEEAYLTPTALTIAGNLTVNGTYYRVGPAAIAVSGALTFGDGATIAVTALSSETSVFDATGAVTISGDLNVLLDSETLTAGEYTIATGASVTRAADSQVVVTVNGTVTDTWALSNTETAVVLTGAAARVNGDTYPTFTEAVTAADGTETIELLAAASYTLTAGETVIVKAGSFTFTVSAPQGYVISETTVSDGVVSYTTSSALVRTTKQVNDSGTWRTADGYPKEYASIVAAIADITIAPVENSTRYTVTMLGNETLATRAEPNYSMTIDLGGYTLTRKGTGGNGSVFDVKSGTVTIKNGTIDCTQDDTAIVAYGVYAITARSGSAVTLEDLTITVDSQAGACVYPFNGATVTIKSGTYKNETAEEYQYKTGWTGMAVNQDNVTTQLLFIEGGKFWQVNPEEGDDSGKVTNFLAAGRIAKLADGYWVVSAGTWVAEVGGTKFESLAEAVTAAESGLTVTLLADVTLNSTLTLPAGKTLTMDLGGFTIYSGNDSSKRIVVNGTVTMTNGVVDGQTTVYDPNNGTAMIRVNGSLTLGANLTIRNTINAVAAFGTGSLTVNGATINALGFAISTNGSATGDNASNGTVLAINSGTITSTDVAVYLPSGTMTINGGTITGSTGVYAKGGSLSVPSTSTAVITGNGANAGWSYNGNGANSTGDALVLDNSAYPYGPATATIAGGTYESTNGDAIGNYTKDAETLPTATGFVTGGTFSSDVSAFCATGYAATETSTGVWTVAKSGIDPTDPTSTQEVTVDTSLTAEEQEAAAIAAATVTVPDGVSGVDAPTYKTYFTYSATPTATAGTYTVAITGLADEVTETADGNALAALEAATAGGTLSAEVAVKPGLYYGTVAGADVTTLKAPAGTLNTTGKLDLSGVTKPSTGEAFFIKIKVGTTAFAAEE